MARHFVGEALAPAVGKVADVALLLTSEIVTNAILYAGSEIELVVEVSGGVVRVEVVDANEDAPRVRRVDITATSGRGLALVDALASSWGVERIPSDGKRVWFEVEC